MLICNYRDALHTNGGRRCDPDRVGKTNIGDITTDIYSYI